MWSGLVWTAKLLSPVGEQQDAVAGGPALGEDEPGGASRLSEQTLAAAEHDREDHQTVCVDKAVLHQAVDQAAASVNQDVAARLRLQPGDLAGDVAPDHLGVLPRGLVVGQRRGDDVLAHGVHLLGVALLVGPARPCLGEPLVGHPPQQEGVAGDQLVELELVSLVAAVELEGPPAVLGALRPAGVIHHSVQRNELRHHELCHDLASCRSMPAPCRRFTSYTNGWDQFRQAGRRKCKTSRARGYAGECRNTQAGRYCGPQLVPWDGGCSSGPATRDLRSHQMLRNGRAISGFSVDDMARAREFYGTTLGLDVADAPLGVEGADVPTGLEIRFADGMRVLIYPKPDHTPAAFTILNFVIDDIEGAVDELSARGVKFAL